jgi:hypothetical protein
MNCSKRFIHLLAAASVATILTMPVAPARAQVTAAAWITARNFCRGLAAGLSIPEATRLAWRDSSPLWSQEMLDPAFNQLLVAESVQQCPGLMMQKASPQ